MRGSELLVLIFFAAHEVGVVTLQVASDGYVISNAVNFEYKSPPKFGTKCEGNGNDMLYKFNLLTRLESIDEKLQIKVEPGELVGFVLSC